MARTPRLLVSVGLVSVCLVAESGPRPARIYVLPDEAFRGVGFRTAARLEATPTVLVVSSGDYRGERIAAFDRKSARKLWSLPRGGGDSGNVAWSLIGTASRRGGSEMLVALRSTEMRKELFGLDARTGAARWRLAPPALDTRVDRAALAMHGGIVSQATSADLPGRTRSPNWQAVFADALTGRPVAPGRNLIRAASRSDTDTGTLALAQTSAYRPCLLRLDTGRSITLQVFRGSEGMGPTGTPVGVLDKRAIVHVATDDDGAGHSGWPRYLFCADSTGSKVWQYPRRLVFPGTSDKTDWKHYESIATAELVPEAHTVVAHSSGGQLTGLRLRRGTVAWRVKAPAASASASMAAFKEGCFVLLGGDTAYAGAPPAWLGYVDARTGRVRRVASLPGARRIWIDRGGLFVLTSKPAVEAYGCAALLARHRKPYTLRAL